MTKGKKSGIIHCKECGKKEHKGKGFCGACFSKDWRKNNPERVKAYADMRYARDREEILSNPKKITKVREANKVYHKKNGYAYDKRPERKVRMKIRNLTRIKYPLEGNNCSNCFNPAEERHHTTEPPEVDKFLFFCRKCHLEFHGSVMRTEKGSPFGSSGK